MSSGLQIRVCTLNKMVSGGGSHSFGQIQPHASTSDIANAIVSLQFDGAFITTDLTNLREMIQLATGAGFPGAAEVLVIGPTDGLSADEIEIASDRAIAVKDFLLSNGVPARNVAVDMPSAFLRPTTAAALPPP